MKAHWLLREARRRAGSTQAELAARTGRPQSVIARWESGRVQPSLETLAACVRACGLELRVGLAEADPDEATRIERNLTLTPAERLDQLVRTVSFVHAGRDALARRHG